MMNSLKPHHLMHLNAAEGWLGLGDPIEANEELKKIAPVLYSHPDVLEVRYRICAQRNVGVSAWTLPKPFCKLPRRVRLGGFGGQTR
jgi:hypothetical protein